MNDFLFFIKAFLLTLVLVLLLQIRIGEQTVEAHTMGWVQSSVVVTPLNHAAQGAAKIVRDLTTALYNGVRGHEKKDDRDRKDKKEERRSSFRWTHAFSREQTDKD
jgi:hypothetical protein